MEADFVKENELYNNVEPLDVEPLNIEISKVRNKYNNLKKQWRTAVDRWLWAPRRERTEMVPDPPTGHQFKT